jgi:hypothetical protein
LATSYTVELTDTIGVADFISKRGVRVAADALGVSDYVGRVPSKAISDGLAVGDAISKRTDKSLEDLVGVADMAKKTFVKRLRERVGMREVVHKAGFTLALEMIPRVYFLPHRYRVLWDIIEEEYHNAKVLACKRIYNYLLWVRRRVLGLKFPGNLREAVGVRDYVSKRVTVARLDRVEYDFFTEEERR